MKVFSLFAELALSGAAEVKAGLADVEQSGGGLSDTLQSVGQGLADAGSNLTMFATGPIVAAATAIMGLTTSIGNAADRILDLSGITGLSTQNIQTYQHMARMAGTDTEALTRSAQHLQRQMTQIQSGTGKAAEAIGELGISTHQFMQLDMDDRMDQLISGLQGVEDPAERARLGTELFGRQWEQIAPIVDLGADKLDELRESGERYAMNDDQLAAANDFRMSMQELKDEVGFATQELALGLLPIAEDMVALFKDQVAPALITGAEKIATLAEWFSELPAPMRNSIVVITALVAALGPALMIIGKVVTVVGKLSAIFGTGAAAVGGFIGTVSGVLPIIAAVVAIVWSAIEIFKEWESTIKTLQYVWQLLKDGLNGAWESIKSFAGDVRDTFNSLVQAVIDTITRMVSGVVDRVKTMVSGALAALRHLYDKAVGNSIIPDMVRDVGAEMADMAATGEEYARQFAGGVENTLAGIQAPEFAPALSGGANGGTGGQQQTVHYDLRYATFRDDKDMERRMRRSGSGLHGF